MTFAAPCFLLQYFRENSPYVSHAKPQFFASQKNKPQSDFNNKNLCKNLASVIHTSL